jgi:hypothetical protein
VRADHSAELSGHVRGYNDIEVQSGIELLEDGGAVPRRFAAAEDLYGVLWFGGRLPERPKQPPPTQPPELLVQALRAYLHEDDIAMRAALEIATSHPSRLVRDGAASLSSKAHLSGFDARLAALKTVQT